MQELNIYGEIGGEFTLVKLESFLNTFSGKTLKVNLHSDGGDVEEAIAIYNRLRKLAQEGVKIITNIEGKCKSSGVTIFLAGDERLINKNTTLFIHQVSSLISGMANPEELEKLKKETEIVQDAMLSIYVSRTGLKADKIAEMLKADTTLNATQALKLKFATKTTFYNMNNNISKFAAFFGVKKLAFKNLIFQSEDGTPYDFPDLKAGDIPKEGDVIQKDGVNFTGEVIIPLLGEAIKITAQDGKITLIEASSGVAPENIENIENIEKIEKIEKIENAVDPTPTVSDTETNTPNKEVLEMQAKIKVLEEKLTKVDTLEAEMANIKKISFGNSIVKGKFTPPTTKRYIEFKVKD